MVAPYAPIVRAGLASVAGDELGVVRELEAAAARCEGDDGNRLLAACIERRLGQWGGGAEGARRMAAAEAVLARAGIESPARWTALHVPGRFGSEIDRGPRAALGKDSA